MGDVHFDLAYFIESSELTKEEEKIFLKAYGDDYEEKYLCTESASQLKSDRGKVAY